MGVLVVVLPCITTITFLFVMNGLSMGVEKGTSQHPKLSLFWTASLLSPGNDSPMEITPFRFINLLQVWLQKCVICSHSHQYLLSVRRESNKYIKIHTGSYLNMGASFTNISWSITGYMKPVSDGLCSILFGNGSSPISCKNLEARSNPIPGTSKWDYVCHVTSCV